MEVAVEVEEPGDDPPQKESGEHGSGYLRRALRYGLRVYKLGTLLDRVRDGRVKQQIEMSTIVRSVFLCGLLRIRSFNALEPQLAEPEMQRALGLPGNGKAPCSVDTLSRALRLTESDCLVQMVSGIVARAERNKVFRSGWVGALRYAAIDGWEPISSRRRHCAQCLERTLTENEEEVTEYYHRYVVALLLGEREEVVLDFEPMRNAAWRRQLGEGNVEGDEGEQTAAIRLLPRLRRNYGWIEVIVADALYANGPFATALDQQSFCGIIIVKKDTDDPLRTALRRWAGKPAEVREDEDARERLHLWDCPQLSMTNYSGSVRVVRGVVEPLTARPALLNRKRQWCMMAIGAAVQRLTPRQVLRVARGRWHLENTGFNQWTQHWKFEHVFVNDGKGITAIFAFFFLAFNLLQLFVYRQLGTYGRLRGKDPTRTILRVVDCMLADLHRLDQTLCWDST